MKPPRGNNRPAETGFRPKSKFQNLLANINALGYNNFMSDELYEEIEKSQFQGRDDFEEIVNAQTMLVFTIGDEYYAVESEAVRVIVRNSEIFPMPFVPPYVKGVLNYYGKPFAIVDFSLFLEKPAQDTKMFMILNGEDSVALQINDIQEFQNATESAVQNFSANANTDYYNGAIMFDSETAPILNLTNILSKIRSDIGKS